MFRVVGCVCVCVVLCVWAFVSDVSVGRSFGARACMFSFPTTTFRTIGIGIVIINTMIIGIVVVLMYFQGVRACGGDFPAFTGQTSM